MRRTILRLAGCISLVACGGGDAEDAAVPGADTMMTEMGSGPAAPAAGASATVRDASGRELGTLSLTEGPQGITVSGTLTGLPPGQHAIHVHTTGSCEPPFDSAEGHWNPTANQHGSENPAGPHFGDLPNLMVADDGTATVQGTTPGGTMGGENALLDADGAALVVHAAADDYRTDPSGSAGARIACGVAAGA